MDPIQSAAGVRPYPPHRDGRLVLLVLAGGMVGTAARQGVALALPRTGAVPWEVLSVNLLGAFVLGLLLAGLAARPTQPPAAQRWRLFAGTGVIGGFTTYSALAGDTAALLANDPLLAVSYATASVLLGLASAGSGLWVGSRVVSPGPPPNDPRATPPGLAP